jgi:carboxypeptidase family protein
MKRSNWITLMLFFLLPAVAFGQTATTGAFAGSVVDADGNSVLGAEVVIVHNPTGTIFTTLTRSNGQFRVPAVRVGGPYTITVSYQGFKTEKKEGLSVKLGETKHVSFKLQLATVDAGEVVVTASTTIINPYRTGASQNVGQESIEDLPTISRDLSSFTRLAPQFSSGEDSGSFSAAGRSPRYNNIQIDGAQNNDLFGLGNSGTPGGQTMVSPISLDAIQEFQIVLAPYDVRHGMFTGGGVNVITKNGTNDFHGSAYFYGRNESLVRKGGGESELREFPEFNESSFGFTFGGPLIKDKLFFFMSGERKQEKSQKDLDYVIDGSGSSTDYGNKDDADQLISILSNQYGYDAGTYGSTANEFDSTQFFVRLDWNINENHRMTLRHNFVDANRDILRRNASYAFALSNQAYLMESTTNSTVMQLNSTLGNSLFNELILNYTTVRDNRSPIGQDFPVVTLNDSGLTAGSEAYSTKNQLDQDLFELTDNLTLYAGDHTITFGTHNEFFKFYNVFVKRAFGHYYFQNIDDLAAGKAYRYRHNYSNTNDPNAPAEFSVSQLGAYVGDDWAITPNIHLTFGVRMDLPVFPDTPGANPAVEAAFGVPTDHMPSGNMLWSPRFGFNIDVFKNKKTQLRGGIGIFSGRTPYVWISNQFVNNGVNLTEIYYTNYGGIDFNPDPYNQPEMSGATEVNLHDANYKFPQTLRTNIAVDQELPHGFTATVEYIYSKAINEIKYQDLNIQQVSSMPDGRPVYGYNNYKTYWDTEYINPEFNHVIYLTNTNEGYNYSLSGQIRKEFKNGGMVNASYAYGMSKDLFSGTSSQAISNWGYNITAGNPNEPNLSYSSHDIRHRFSFAIVKKFNLISATAPTTVSLFYEGRSGRPYSTRYYYDFNGDGRSNDSIYVPLNEGDIILTDNSWAELDAYIKGDPALEAHRGQIMPRNASRDPWSHRIDVKFAQVIPLPGLKDSKLLFTFDIENFANLLNKDWGYYKYIQFDDAPLRWEGWADNGQPKFSFRGDASTEDARFILNQEFSRWRGMIGLKYKF